MANLAMDAVGARLPPVQNTTESQATLAQRMAMRQTPDAHFFANYLQTYAAQQSQTALASAEAWHTTETASNSVCPAVLDQLLGDVHRAYAARRGVSETEQAQYAQILQRAYAGSGMTDPVGFLQTLTAAELAVVQRNHCLAQAIVPAGLSREGAANLLLPEGWRLDLDHNDLIEVGTARLIQFPPLDAPETFTNAWLVSTQDMDDMEISSYGLRLFIGMHTLTEQPQRLLPADQLETYQILVERLLAMLESLRDQLPVAQYQRDKAFFSHLQAQLQAA